MKVLRRNNTSYPWLVLVFFLVLFLVLKQKNGTRIPAVQPTSLVSLAELRQKDISLEDGTTVKKAISVIHFSSGRDNRTELLENAAYTLSKLAKTENYLIAVLDRTSLQLCLNTGLPCADATPIFDDMRTTDSAEDADVFMSAAYVETTWKKVRVVYELLKHGFSVHSSDFDITYAPKGSLWKHYVKYMIQGNADAAFQVEMAGINTGNYVILNNDHALEFVKRWLALETPDENDQVALNNALLQSTSHNVPQEEEDLRWFSRQASHVEICVDVQECPQVTLEDEMHVFTIRRYYPPYWNTYKDHCIFNGENKDIVQQFDICHPSVLYIHPICTGGGHTADVKLSSLHSLKAFLLPQDVQNEADKNDYDTQFCSKNAWDPFDS